MSLVVGEPGVDLVQASVEGIDLRAHPGLVGNHPHHVEERPDLASYLAQIVQGPLALHVALGPPCRIVGVVEVLQRPAPARQVVELAPIHGFADQPLHVSHRFVHAENAIGVVGRRSDDKLIPNGGELNRDTSQTLGTQVETSPRVVVRTSWGFFVNSILAAALAVVFARSIEQFGVAVAGALFGRDPVLGVTITEFRADGSDAVLLGGTIASLVAGSVGLLLFPAAKDRSAGKLMLLWLILFTFRNGLMDLATSPFFAESPVAITLDTFDAPEGLDVVVSAGGWVGLLLVGVAAAAAFLGFARHRAEIATPKERLRFITAIALIPAVVGPLLAVPYFVAADPVGYIRTLPTVGLFILITVGAAPLTRHVRLPDLGEERGLSPGLVAALAITYLGLRWAIGPGVPIPPWGENFEWRFRE